jgi:hypothetical protein
MTEQNKAVVRQYVQAFNEGDAPDGVNGVSECAGRAGK